ncbi:alginate lyase family protein [Polaribacter pectinis]|uniref:Alginate lyase family protein n=2 Tax=Polaribacter pectinis TaxID=2738844 RepID=A0A7G9LEI5_9FLAO|nr:alginate lyase family protein [Polaribacter pectinis]
MGARYLFFRIFYTIKTKLGWQKKKFPVQPNFESYISLEKWRNNLPPFFFYGKNIPNLERGESSELLENFKDIQKGFFTFFNKTKIDLGANYDWLTNPDTGFKYDINKHWSEIQDLSSEAGDIKYVWEKARFSFLYDVIRYDYHYNDDQSKYVFGEIEDFINNNPINQGPNYKCSQEISLRVLNWTFVLYYYKDSENLTDVLFDKIMHHIFWQIHHVFHNIHFSRITVRNNHAITETLMLYLSEKLFPFFPDVKKWSKKGKKWFEQEIAYQIYEDGTFLQFSMNYHRVVIQLLTWGIQLAKINEDKFKDVVYNRAQKSLDFLDACSDSITGKLPNYGSNDGALFFKLTNDDYRVYTSQLEDLRAVLNEYTFNKSKSNLWYGVNPNQKEKQKQPEVNVFKKGGYYIIQEGATKTFIRCGAYKDRPFQSDNLHLDIWANGVNYLRDSGSYKYNTTLENINYFTGVEGHNTIGIEGYNQMLKGGRFIWYYWINKVKANLVKDQNTFKFEGSINAFKQLTRNIIHVRKINKTISKNTWKIIDSVNNKGSRKIYQYWHLNPDYLNEIEIVTKDCDGNILKPKIEEKWFSGYYGIKEKAIRLTFVTEKNTFNTTIRIN